MSYGVQVRIPYCVPTGTTVEGQLNASNTSGSTICSGSAGTGQVLNYYNAYIVKGTSASLMETALTPFEPAQSAIFFAAAFIPTVSLFLATKAIGSVIKFIKDQTK
jgi:hypothetical protein